MGKNMREMHRRSRSNPRGFSRRKWLQLSGAALGASMSFGPRMARADDHAGLRKFLFVVGATGGANITDMLLPVAASEPSSAASANNLIVYPEEILAQPAGSNLRVVRNFAPSTLFRSDYQTETFLQQHASDSLVVAMEGTSVNHIVAQKRAVTGAGINGGRTIMEAMAERYGSDLPLPNVNMGFGGLAKPGDDPTLSNLYRGELITNPTLFGASTDAHRGVLNAPPKNLFDRARGIREQLDDASGFGQTFRRSPLRQNWLSARRERGPALGTLTS